MSNDNGKQPNSGPKEDPRFAPLDARDCYYFVTAQWVELRQPELIAKPGEELRAPQVIAIPHVENFFINMHPCAFWLLNRAKYPQFAVTESLVITRKMYEAAMLVMGNAAAAQEEAMIEQQVDEAIAATDAETQTPLAIEHTEPPAN